MAELLDQVRYYLNALWRRRWMALGIAVVCAGAGWSWVASMPNKYEATSKIYVDTQTILGPLLDDVAVQGNLNRQLEVMRKTIKSRPNLKKVAHQTDLAVQAEGPKAFDRLISGLREDIRVQSARERNLFTIRYRHPDRDTARSVVQSVTRLFVENNLGASRSEMENAQQFLDDKISQYERQLDRAESRLAEFKKENRAYMPGQSGLQERLRAAKTRLEDATAELKNARQRAAMLDRELSNTPKMLEQQAAGSPGPPSETTKRIMELRGRLESLRARYTDKHPDVVRTERKLEALKEERRAMAGGPGGEADDGSDAGSGPGGPGSGTSTSTAIKVPNPTYGRIQTRLLEQRSRVETLLQKVRSAREDVRQAKAKVEKVPEVEAKLKELTRDYEVIKSKYKTLLSRRESAEISSARRQQTDSVKFQIVQPATAPRIPVGPPRATMIAGIFVVSLGAGAGSSWLLALTKTSYGSVRHLQKDFDMPVVGALSEVPEPGEGVRKVARHGLFGAFAAVFISSFASLMLIEQQVGLHAVTSGAVEFDRVSEALRMAVTGGGARQG